MQPATASLRAQHRHLMDALALIRQTQAAVRIANADQAGAQMDQVLEFVRLHIAPRAAWEEAVLYPAIDAVMGNTDPPFTSVMRQEHGLVAGWMQQLMSWRAEASSPEAQQRFAIEACSMLAFIRAHFQVQEDTLLPILDRIMTAAQFEADFMVSQPPEVRELRGL